MWQIMKRTLLLLLAPVCLLSPAQAQEEELCQKLLSRFMGLQAHVKQEGPTAVPQFKVGLSAEKIEKQVQRDGACATWNTLVKSLQKQHANVLDKTEKKTGKPSPVR